MLIYYLSPSFPRFVNELYIKILKDVLQIIRLNSFISFIDPVMSCKVLDTSF